MLVAGLVLGLMNERKTIRKKRKRISQQLLLNELMILFLLPVLPNCP